MQDDYNMNQLVLDITTSYIPEKNNVAWFINDLVENLKSKEKNVFGRPRKYNLALMLKLVLFAYSRGVFSCRRIEQFAKENLPARWLTQENFPSYRTIARFRISKDLEGLIQNSFNSLVVYLRKNHLIDDAIFIDGTKILADANKFSFVWKKSTIRFDQMNKEKIVVLMSELKESYRTQNIPEGSNLTFETIDDTIARLDQRLEELETSINNSPKVSPNPDKQERRNLKSKKRILDERRQTMVEHENRISICGNRNSYSKTDHDATFMRVKEDPMLNGQLKPAYNLQIATNNRFVLNYDLYQNPTDTRTLIPFLEKLDLKNELHKYIVADAGYGSELNYRYLEDNLSQHTALIPYGTMLKERSRKWKSDEKKVMNWDYYAEQDYYLTPNGLRYNFYAYRTRKDKDGLQRTYKEYQAEKFDENHHIIKDALTPKGNIKKIQVNPEWEYFKAKQNELLSTSETGKVFARRKIDVETVFGGLKAYLHFTRFSVRGMEKVKLESGLALLAMNMRKLAVVIASSSKTDIQNLAKGKKIIREKIFFKFFSELFFYFKLLNNSYILFECSQIA